MDGKRFKPNPNFVLNLYMVDLEELLRESGLCSSPETLFLFKSLKRRLHIEHVKVSGEAVKIFLRNCPLLEELIIGSSCVTSSVEVCGASLLLKHLEVWQTHGKKSLRVSAPNLTQLKFSDTVGELFLESLPKLVEAEFEFGNPRVDDVIQNVAPALFRFSSQLEILKLSLRCPKVFLANEFPEMPKLRKLEVEYDGVKTHSLLPVTALLWASPHLEEFKLVFREMDSGDAPIQVRRNGERRPHLHLKLFELTGILVCTVGHVELATYISDNCVGLEKIKIFVGHPPVSYTEIS